MRNLAEPLIEHMVFDYKPFQIESGKIKEFASALGIENRIYFEKELAVQKGHKDIPVPPTFGTVIDYWNDRDFYQLFQLLDLDPSNVLHGEQLYEYVSDIYAGDTISSQMFLLNQFHKKGKNFFFLETIYKNQYKEIVLINRATMIQLVEVSL